ncbi:MAG TPA: hypothetical protein VGL77_10510, partial [Armatimonadota bacterium]
DGHLQWVSATTITPAFFLPSIPAADITTPLTLGSLFDNLVHKDGSKYTQKVSLALANAGLTTALGTSLGNAYVGFYDGTGGNALYAISGTTNEISSTIYIYDPAANTTPHMVPWWKYGAGGTTITGMNYTGFDCGWGTAKNLYAITGLANATPASTTLVIKPKTSGVKKMALVAYNALAGVTVVATMNYIRLGSDTTTTFSSANTTTAVPGATTFTASAIGYVLPVQANQDITIKYTAQGGRGGAILVFED